MLTECWSPAKAVAKSRPKRGRTRIAAKTLSIADTGKINTDYEGYRTYLIRESDRVARLVLYGYDENGGHLTRMYRKVGDTLSKKWQRKNANVQNYETVFGKCRGELAYLFENNYSPQTYAAK